MKLLHNVWIFFAFLFKYISLRMSTPIILPLNKSSFVCLYYTHQCRDWFFSLGPSDCINRQMTDTSEFLDEVTFSFSLFPLEKLGFFLLMYIFHWSIVHLQCFRCAARWLSYIYAHILFLKLFSTVCYYKILTIAPCAIQ